MVETNEWTVTKNMGSFQIEVRGIDGIWQQVMWLRGNQGTPWIDKGVILKVAFAFFPFDAQIIWFWNQDARYALDALSLRHTFTPFPSFTA